MISPVFALTIEFLNFGAKKDGEELYGGVVFFVFSNALEEYDVDGFFVGGLESIDGRRTVLRTPPFPPLDELKGLLFVSLRSPAMLNVFVFFLTNSSVCGTPFPPHTCARKRRRAAGPPWHMVHQRVTTYMRRL